LIRNFSKLRLTTCVIIALRTTRNLSRDRDVAPHVYIKSRITRFIISWDLGIPSLTTEPITGLAALAWCKETYQWIGLPKRDLRFSGYDATDNLCLSPMKE